MRQGGITENSTNPDLTDEAILGNGTMLLIHTVRHFSFVMAYSYWLSAGKPTGSSVCKNIAPDKVTTVSQKVFFVNPCHAETRYTLPLQKQ